MPVSKALVGWLCAGLLCAAAWAQEAGGAQAGLDALKKQEQDLRAKETEIRGKLDEVQKKIGASPEVVKFREAEDAAAKAYDEKRAADKAYVAARQAMEDAQRALDKLVQDKAAASDQAKPILAELLGIEQKRADLEFQQAQARLELDDPNSPINFALSHDPELIKLHDAVDAAQTKEARDEARKACEAARQAKKDAMPEAQKAVALIADARKARDELSQQEKDVRKKLDAIRHEIEKSEAPDLKAAREKVDAAQKAHEEARQSPELAAARKAREDAADARHEKVKALLAADEAAAPLIKELDAARETRHDVEKQIREAEK